jgi:hypothetical protein
MSYIDQQYYNDVYKGVPIAGDAFSSLSERASGVIDQATGFKLKHRPIEEQPQFIQDMLKMATASQTEFMSVNGGSLGVHGSSGLKNVNIGSFSYDGGAGSSVVLSNAAVGYLNASGLLYSGVSVYDSTYSY